MKYWDISVTCKKITNKTVFTQKKDVKGYSGFTSGTRQYTMEGSFDFSIDKTKLRIRRKKSRYFNYTQKTYS